MYKKLLNVIVKLTEKVAMLADNQMRIYEKGVRAGNEALHAVLTIEQNLSEEEKKQARKNTGAVASVNGQTPDQNGNVQVELGSGNMIFRVDLQDGYPLDVTTESVSENEFIASVLAAIRAGKIIEVYQSDEGEVEKVTYGWRCEGAYDEESDTHYIRYYVGNYSFADRDFEQSGGGDDSGTEDDSGDVESIIFTIDCEEYEALDGMTWEEWCNSEYNTNGFYAEGEYIYAQSGAFLMSDDGITNASPSDLIKGHDYITMV